MKELAALVTENLAGENILFLRNLYFCVTYDMLAVEDDFFQSEWYGLRYFFTAMDGSQLILFSACNGDESLFIQRFTMHRLILSEKDINIQNARIKGNKRHTYVLIFETQFFT